MLYLPETFGWSGHPIICRADAILMKLIETFPNRPHPTYRNTTQPNEDTIMQNETRASVSTKADKNATEAVKTALIIDWSGCSVEEIQAMAQQALVVKLQAGWRKNGIPTEVTVKAADHKVGTRAPKKSLLESVATLSAEDKAKLLAMLTKGE